MKRLILIVSAALMLTGCFYQAPSIVSELSEALAEPAPVPVKEVYPVPYRR